MGTGRRIAAGVLGVALLGACTSAPPGRRAEPQVTSSATPDAPSARPSTSSPSPSAVPTSTGTAVERGRTSPARNRPVLTSFSACAPLLGRMRSEALRVVGPYGLASGLYGHGGGFTGGAPMPAPAAPGTAPGSAPRAPSSDSGHSTTNNQEAGVDEPDVVQSDGRLLAAIRYGAQGVQLVDLSGATPRPRGFLRLREAVYASRLLLVDGRLVVLGPALAPPDSGPRGPRTSVTVVSLADLDTPRVERTLEVEGFLVAARAVAGRVLLVLQSGPEIQFTYPADESPAAARKATEANRRRVRAATLDQWLPSVTVKGTGRTYRASCGRAYAANNDAGADIASVVSLDPGSDVPGEHVAVAGSANVVYASLTSLYLTSLRVPEPTTDGAPPPPPAAPSTDVHAFDISDPAHPTYAGSGRVAGTVLGQYSMSEHEGHLRVATTLDPVWNEAGSETEKSDNLLTVLRRGGGALVRAGELRGMGRGERIYGVRFQGDLGYVVTFRQTDPLYVLDLSVPERPVARGELKVTGYSSYLHPLGDGRLLGLGQEVDPKSSRVMGTQVSVFDVRDPGAPSLRSRQVFPRGHSAAESDPLAFLWWPAKRLAVVPLWQHSERSSEWFAGAVGLRVDATGALTEVGRLRHPDAEAGDPYDVPALHRTVVVGDRLVTVFDDGVLTSSLDTLERRSWSPYR